MISSWPVNVPLPGALLVPRVPQVVPLHDLLVVVLSRLRPQSGPLLPRLLRQLPQLGLKRESVWSVSLNFPRKMFHFLGYDPIVLNTEQLTSFSSFFLEASFFSRLALASTASLAFLSAMKSDSASLEKPSLMWTWKKIRIENWPIQIGVQGFHLVLKHSSLISI